MSFLWLSGSEVGGKAARDRLPLACARCGNRCRLPTFAWRVYACPRCGQYLVSADSDGRAVEAPRRVLRAGAVARAFLMATLLLATVGVVTFLGLSSYRAAVAGPEAAPPHPVQVRLTPAEAQGYADRQRQLEQDLARDDQDFEVLECLGRLHLQLAECQSQLEARQVHLRRARYYLLRAGMNTMGRMDAFRVRALLEAANSPNPSFMLASMTGDAIGPAREDEAMLRMLIGLHKERAGYEPRNSRLLRRLGEDYAALYRIMDRRGDAHLAGWEGGSAVSDPGEAKRLAEGCFRRAIECARTREARCRALHSAAELYRATNEPARSAVLLEQLLSIQPNNWLVSLETASLYRQLGQAAKAERFQALAARWRTPGWI